MGGRFEIFGGAVKGAFTALEPPGTIGLSWRFANWPDGTTSKVSPFACLSLLDSCHGMLEPATLRQQNAG